MAETTGNGSGELQDALRDDSTEAPGSALPELDVSLLEHSLPMTPRERMLANDDALNFAEPLRSAMLKRHSCLHSR